MLYLYSIGVRKGMALVKESTDNWKPIFLSSILDAVFSVIVYAMISYSALLNSGQME